MNKKSRDENNVVDSASKSEPAGREEASCGGTSGQVVAGPARTDVKDVGLDDNLTYTLN